MNRRGAYVKKDQNIANVVARRRWLLAGLDAPDQLTEVCIASLAHQRSFAALRVTGTPIQPMALNTLKSIANEVLAGDASEGEGFAQLESLRLRLKNATVERPAARTVEARHRRRDRSFDELTRALRLTELSNLQRSHAYVDLFSKVVALMKGAVLDDATRLRLHNLLQDHRQLYAPLLAPVPIPTADNALRVIPGSKP